MLSVFLEILIFSDFLSLKAKNSALEHPRNAPHKIILSKKYLPLGTGLIPAAAFYDGAYGKVDLEKIGKGPATDFSDVKKINIDPNEESKCVALKMQEHFATFMGTVRYN